MILSIKDFQVIYNCSRITAIKKRTIIKEFFNINDVTIYHLFEYMKINIETRNGLIIYEKIKKSINMN